MRTGGLDLSGISPRVEAQITDRLLSAQWSAWAETAARVGHCARPIRLRGHNLRVDLATGEVLSSYTSASEPLGVTHVRCGNRRESVCPSCSRVYAADTFHLIRAGVTGGKGVPEQVADNPLVFATLTAPSFGHVHGTRPNAGRCRPRTGRDSRCSHGRPVGCMTVHDDDDQAVGQPLCPDCYDYEAHVLWQWWAPELWRRFTIALRRHVARRLGVPPTLLAEVATVQYAKVAEYQRRGIIHFHALIRLDGPKTPDGFAPAPDRFTAAALAEVVATAVAAVSYLAPPVARGDAGRVLRFGTQVDARAVRTANRTDAPGESLSGEQVAGYIAKYATKSATDTVDTHRGSAHLRRIRHTALDLAEASPGCRDGDESPYELLGKWVHMLAFRGHFSTKSRRYSVTLGALRRARRRWQTITARSRATGRPPDDADLEAALLADDQDTTLVISQWAFIGSGWQTEGDAALARAAAARAREYAKERAMDRHRSTSMERQTNGRD